MIPVLVAAREARNLQRQNDPDLAQSSGGHQFLKAEPFLRVCTRLAQVFIDQHDLLPRPAECAGSVDQSALTPLAFPVVNDLMLAGLTDVNVSLTARVSAGDLFRVHRSSPGRLSGFSSEPS